MVPCSTTTTGSRRDRRYVGRHRDPCGRGRRGDLRSRDRRCQRAKTVGRQLPRVRDRSRQPARPGHQQKSGRATCGSGVRDRAGDRAPRPAGSSGLRRLRQRQRSPCWTELRRLSLVRAGARHTRAAVMEGRRFRAYGYCVRARAVGACSRGRSCSPAPAPACYAVGHGDKVVTGDIVAMSRAPHHSRPINAISNASLYVAVRIFRHAGGGPSGLACVSPFLRPARTRNLDRH